MSDRASRSTVKDTPNIFLGVVEQVRAMLPAHLRKWHVDDHGCWIWEGHRGSQGWAGSTTYAVAPATRYRKGSAYRNIWEIVNGRFVTPGLEMDHTCQRGGAGCVNPFHIVESDHKTNLYRNPSHAFVANALKTHCKNGHDLTDPANVQKQSPKAGGGRMCKLCNRETAGRWAKEHRDELNARRRQQYAENREEELRKAAAKREKYREQRRESDRRYRERKKLERAS